MWLIMTNINTSISEHMAKTQEWCEVRRNRLVIIIHFDWFINKIYGSLYEHWQKRRKDFKGENITSSHLSSLFFSLKCQVLSWAEPPFSVVQSPCAPNIACWLVAASPWWAGQGQSQAAPLSAWQLHIPGGLTFEMEAVDKIEGVLGEK